MKQSYKKGATGVSKIASSATIRALVAFATTSIILLPSLDSPLTFLSTRLANDAKSAAKGGGGRQFNGLVDVYRKTLASDGIAGLYRGAQPYSLLPPDIN